MKKHLRLLLLFFSFFLCQPCQAGYKEPFLPSTGELVNFLRWDNLKNCQEQICPKEIELRYSRKHGLHLFTLEPGESISFRVEPFFMLRLFAPYSKLDGSELRYMRSNGSGIKAEIKPTLTDDRRNLLVTPRGGNPIIFQLQRPDDSEDDFSFAVFFSRERRLPADLGTARILPLSTDSVHIHDQAEQYELWPLLANRKVELTVLGPANLVLETRLIYPKSYLHQQQNYQVAFSGDDIPGGLFEIRTTVEENTAFSAGDELPVLGRLRRRYFKVPEGEHTLRLQASHELLARVLTVDEDEYLFPSLNRMAAEETATSRFQPRSAWSLDQEQLLFFAEADNAEPEDVFLAARGLMRNHLHPDSPLLGAQLLSNLLARKNDSSLLMEEARQLIHDASFWQHLFPDRESHGLIKQEFRRCLALKLKRKTDSHTVLAEQFGAAFQEAPGKGYFFELRSPDLNDGQDTLSGKLHFRLPDQPSSRFLRIMAQKGQIPLSFSITTDTGTEQHFTVLPVLEQPRSEYRFSQAEAGAVFERLIDATYPRKVGLQPQLPLIEAAHYDLVLPAEVKTITLIPDEKNQASLHVALKTRKARPFRLSEEEFLAAHWASDAERTAFADFLAVIQSWPDLPGDRRDSATNLSEALRLERISQFIFLVRTFNSMAVRFEASVVPLHRKKQDTKNQIRGSRKKALQAVRSNQWLQALDQWSNLVGAASHTSSSEARLGQAEALIRLGEHNMAQTLLRGIWLYPVGKEQEALSTAAFHRLEALYLDTKNSNALLSLYAAQFLKKPNKKLLRTIADHALEQNHFDLTLLTSLILVPDERSHTTVLRAALRKGWFQVFQDEIKLLEDKKEQAYWQAIFLLRNGRHKKAHELLSQAGQAGKELGKALDQALSIRQGIQDAGTPEEQDCAIAAWEAWQETHPGPFFSQTEPWLITSHNGGLPLYNPARDLPSQYFMASADRPVTMRVHGPVRLRITARPLRPSAESSLDGWLEIRQEDTLHITPISGNKPAPGLLFREDQRHKPGRAVITEYFVGPGEHTLIAASPEMDLALHIAALRPEISTYILPILNEAALTNLENAAKKPRKQLVPTNTVACLTEDCLTLHNRDKGSDRSWTVSAVRDALAQTIEVKRSMSLPVRQQTADSSTTTEKLSPLVIRFPVDQEKEVLLSLVDSCVDGISKEAISTCMSALVRLGERFPEEKERAAVIAEKMLFTEPEAVGLDRLASRLLTRASWQPARFVTSEEGIRFIAKTEGWVPDTPALQHRKAFLRLNQDEQILFDAKPLVLDMDNIKPADLRITLTLEEMPYAPPQPLVLFVQVDKERPERLVLHHEQPVLKKKLHLGAGHHQVRLTLTERYANQFLRVRFHEPGTAGDSSEWSHQQEKPYYVSSKKHPIRVRVQGPALVRADEYQKKYQAKKKKSTYHFVDTGWHEIKLPPSGNRRSLYRLFQRMPDSSTALALEAPKKIVPVDQSQPLFSLASLPTDKVTPEDAYPPGMQEDGTWEWRAGLHQRRTVQEDTDLLETEDFLQLSSTHRYYRESKEDYFRTNFLLRFREHGGPVAGLRHKYHRLLGYRPLTFAADASVYVQAPDEAEEDSSSQADAETEIIVFLQAALAGKYHLGPKTWHVPRLSAFSRFLSLDGVEGDGRRVDQDIFTPYKEDHLYGIGLGETLWFRPWLDTLLFAGAGLGMNENPFEPDFLKFRFGVKQLFWPVQADLTYMAGHYFKDDDRDAAATRNTLRLDLTADHWQENQRRLRAGLRAQTDLDTGEHSGFVFFSWIFSRSRGVRDFRAGELPFKGLRERMLVDTKNNALRYL